MHVGDEAALASGFLGFICLLIAVAIVVAIFYFLTLQKALSRVSRRNRLMEPGLVWLGLIPVFNLIWSFFIATGVPGSLRNEFEDQGRDDGSDYGQGIGLANAIINVIAFPVSFLVQRAQEPRLALIELPFGLASLVLFIIFWVKIAGYSSRLARSRRYRRDEWGYDENDRYDDEEEDYRERGRPGGPSDAIRPDERDRYER